jgi:mono/diheme cytochrome c family protein
VALIVLAVEAPPAFGAESKGTTSVQSKYEARCVRCHGVSGKGNGTQAKMVFWMKMPNFTDSAYMQTRSDDVLFQKIKAGGQGGMPAYTLEFSDSDIKDMVAYIRNFSKAPGPAKPAGAPR